MPAKICFFDVDHTLTRRSAGYHFALEAKERGLFKARHFTSIPFTYLSYRFGRAGLDALDNGFTALKGFSRELLEEIAVDAFDKRTRLDFFPDALKLVSRLKDEGNRIILATAGLDFIVKPLAEYLGVDSYVGSSLEFTKGLSTGYFLGRLVFGQIKRDAALEAASRYNQTLSECSFYSDSIHDLPLLLEAGNPIAVNPDRRLAREARRRNWEILHFR